MVARGDDAYINEGHVSGASALMSRSLSEGDERYLLTDYLGTTLAAFDAEGDRNEPTEVTAWNYIRTSFGTGSDSPEAMSRFTGKPYDADLGAHVFPYRNYRSDIGRWMSADPIGFPDGPNQHFYAPVPTMGVDPLGLWVVSVTTSVGAPNGQTLVLPNQQTHMNVQMFGSYSVTLTRQEGDVGAGIFHFQVQLATGGIIIADLAGSVTVNADQNSHTVSGSILGVRSLPEGDYSFGVRVVSNPGGQISNPSVGQFTVKEI